MSHLPYAFPKSGKLLGITFVAGAMLLSARADWPEFRGPTGDGYVTKDAKTIGLPLTWSETNHIKWKVNIHDHGFSTPVILGGQIWLTSATEEGNDFFVLCIDEKTGETLLDQKLFHCEKPEPQGNAVNTYATPTCAIETGRVYVHFGSYGTACLDTGTRKVIWQRQDLPCRHYRGPSSSLVLFENLVILTMDGADVQYLAALDKATGKTIWKTDRSIAWNDRDTTDKMILEGDRRKAHSTPLITNVNGTPVLYSVGAKAAYAYDPRTGKEIWRVGFPGAWSAAPCPVYANGLVYVSTGWGDTKLLAIRTDGHGDVTTDHVAWSITKSVPRYASPILVDGLLYLVSDDGILSCLEPDSGKEVWHSGIGGNYAASPIYADGRIYFFNQQGKTTVIKPGRSFNVMAINKLSSGLMASPAVDGKALFLRTKKALIRIEGE